MLSNAYFLAKFRFDTAENEPAKNLQNFANFPNFANPEARRMERKEVQLVPCDGGVRMRTAQIQKMKACDAGHNAPRLRA